jgi:mRNA-degrading endonuclease RelE of RelBE toxin-antitoxin system
MMGQHEEAIAAQKEALLRNPNYFWPYTELANNYLDAWWAQQLHDPQAGKVIPGTGGLRKIRWGDPRRGKGKRGGLRIIYYYLQEASHIWLISVYDTDDLTDSQKKAYRKFVDDIKTAWAVTRKVGS